MSNDIPRIPPRGPSGVSRPRPAPFTLYEAAKVWGAVIAFIVFGVPLAIALWKWAVA
jgi:hypothetical protein